MKYNYADDWNHKNIETDTEWSHLIKGDKLYLSFKGSTSKLDWKQNIDFLVVPYKHMKKKFLVHRGFQKKYKSIQDDVFDLIEKEGLEVEALGHSQGGALAERFHEDYAYRYGKEPHTITTGKPRSFGWWNSKILKKRFTNLFNYQVTKDWVPKLPPVIFGFRHYGNIIKLKAKYGLFKVEQNHMSYGGF